MMIWKKRREALDTILTEKITALIVHVREVAENPEANEGVLRDYLRESMRVIETLEGSRLHQSKTIGRMSRQFAVLSGLFLALAGWQIAVANGWV